MSFLSRFFGSSNTFAWKKYGPLVDAINAKESTYQALNNDELQAQTLKFRERLAAGETLEDLLVDAFAAAREAAKRTLGQRHYDEQLIGGIVIHHGQIAEMRTGEGKTLVATLPAYLNALASKGVHVVTVNDYLAKRDAQWMGQVYTALGITVASIGHETALQCDGEAGEMKRITRAQAYQCDITYGTNNEFGFDCLRDNMAMEATQIVQRPFSFAIVDEVDSILVDEARTPLIISAPAEDSTDLYYKFAQLAKKLDSTADYTIDEKLRSAVLTEQGMNKVEQVLGIQNLYAIEELKTLHHVEQALKAEALFSRDRDYVVKEGEVIIVDEFTGRMMLGRRYSEGLHQAIEAKEGVQIQRESQTLATVTIQNYFRLYPKLSGMTGTAATEAEEFSKIYKLEVIVIPPHRPVVRKDLQDRVYKNEKGKFQAVVREIKERQALGQPVLVGTVSIEKNERLSEMLAAEGVPFQMLNAKNHEREASIIAEAGRIGAVTIATNMAGRGVDIILGGIPPQAVEETRDERQETSAGNEVAVVATGPLVSTRSLEDWKKEHDEVVRLGGLHVIGTERHESRRIDNQLRGRSGRQGDPGSSQFYISMEDDIMRIFGSDRVKNVMERLGLPDDVPIENRLVSKSIETAQHKVESHNFDTRKHLVEYDDVANRHREVVYKRRRECLEDSAGNRQRILAMVEQEIDVLLGAAFPEEGESNVEFFLEQLATILPLDPESIEAIKAVALNQDVQLWQKRTRIGEVVLPLAKTLYERLVVGIQEEGVRRSLGSDAMEQIERQVLLRSLDLLWIDHLDAMDHLRTGIGLRGYGQRDPLVEYKQESYRMFTEFLNQLSHQVVTTIYKVGVMSGFAPSVFDRQGVTFSAPAKELNEGNGKHESGSTNQGSSQVVSSKLEADGSPEVGRNDPCPCGSGKKYKKCHGK